MKRLYTTLFDNWINTIITLIVTIFVTWLIYNLTIWGIVNAVFVSDIAACNNIRGVGACWGVITEKWKIIIFNRIPYLDTWRPLIGSILLIGSCLILMFSKKFTSNTIFYYCLTLFLSCYLVFFGWPFPSFSSELIGGLYITLFLGIVSNLLSIPLAVVLAIGRLSNNSFFRIPSAIFVEFFRGIPLLGTLFIVSVALPILLPAGITVNIIIPVMIGFICLSAAYKAEIIRSGILSIDRSQYDAANSLGLSYITTWKNIILPQVFIKIMSPLMDNIISILKETVLASIVGVFDLFGSLQLALGDAQWRPFFIEGFIVVSLIYWVLSSLLSTYSKHLEKKLKRYMYD
jgi:general L-amino acid transport system permease protein